jgi:hypothetical protein
MIKRGIIRWMLWRLAAKRWNLVAATTRTCTVDAETRTCTVDAETRTCTVEAT